MQPAMAEVIWDDNFLTSVILNNRLAKRETENLIILRSPLSQFFHLAIIQN